MFNLIKVNFHQNDVYYQTPSRAGGEDVHKQHNQSVVWRSSDSGLSWNCAGNSSKWSLLAGGCFGLQTLVDLWYCISRHIWEGGTRNGGGHFSARHTQQTNQTKSEQRERESVWDVGKVAQIFAHTEQNLISNGVCNQVWMQIGKSNLMQDCWGHVDDLLQHAGRLTDCWWEQVVGIWRGGVISFGWNGMLMGQGGIFEANLVVETCFGRSFKEMFHLIVNFYIC